MRRATREGERARERPSDGTRGTPPRVYRYFALASANACVYARVLMSAGGKGLAREKKVQKNLLILDVKYDVTFLVY